jgi:hypothetical protein
MISYKLGLNLETVFSYKCRYAECRGAFWQKCNNLINLFRSSHRCRAVRRQPHQLLHPNQEAHLRGQCYKTFYGRKLRLFIIS